MGREIAVMMTRVVSASESENGGREGHLTTIRPLASRDVVRWSLLSTRLGALMPDMYEHLKVSRLFNGELYPGADVLFLRCVPRLVMGYRNVGSSGRCPFRASAGCRKGAGHNKRLRTDADERGSWPEQKSS